MTRRWTRSLAYFKPDLGRIAAAFGLLLLSAAASVAKPWPLALIVDSVLGDRPLPGVAGELLNGVAAPIQLAALALSLFFIHTAHGALSAWQNYLTIQIGLRGLARVRFEVFAWLQRLSLRFFQKVPHGDLIHRASWDSYSFQTLFQQGACAAASAGVTLALMVWVMGRMNGALTWAALATAPFLFAAMSVFSGKIRRRSLAAHKADADVTARLEQQIVALPVIQSFTREEPERRRFNETAQGALRSRTAQHAWELLYWLAIAVIFAGGTAVITWVGARQVAAGRLTVGELLVFLSYLAQLYEPLNQLSHVGGAVSNAQAGIQRIFEVLDSPEDVREAPKARSVVGHSRQAGAGEHPEGALVNRGSVSVEGLWFGFDEDRPVLRDVSFEVGPGESLAIVGPSGAGKTTLLHLLTRFHDPSKGRVLLQGEDIRGLKLRDVRAQFAMVFQEPLLLAATIGENIAFGRPEATKDEIAAAATAANASGFIEALPDGYETRVGDGAARLSVGEKQRISLARAFLKDAPIVLLDEPTSALDAESEALVLESLGRLTAGRTALMVAHRWSTIRGAQRAMSLESGRVAEIGSLEELARGTGYISRLAASSRSAGRPK